MEHFYTIQGEGFYSGSPAYFIRLGGCDVGCTWCDVKESWDADKHEKFSSDQILEWILLSKARLCVITGGEPLMHDLSDLTQLLHKNRILINIETSGTSPISGHLDWITFSPKRFKKALPEFFLHTHELKIIVAHPNDLRWGEEFASQVSPNCHLYLQPEWSKEKEVLPTIIDFVKSNPDWKISLQTHKYMGID